MYFPPKSLIDASRAKMLSECVSSWWENWKIGGLGHCERGGGELAGKWASFADADNDPAT